MYSVVSLAGFNLTELSYEIHGHSYTLKLPVLFSSLVECSIIIFSAVLLLTCPHISTAVTVTMGYPSPAQKSEKVIVKLAVVSSAGTLNERELTSTT